MIAENAGRLPGRTRGELELAAMGVRVREAIREYRSRRVTQKSSHTRLRLGDFMMQTTLKTE